MNHYKYIIIGAGLSGLTTAYELLKRGEEDFLILEGRNRVGGRILSRNNMDMGPTWIHQPHSMIKNLCSELDIALFDQYSSGKSMMVYDVNAEPHYFETDPRELPSHRIRGGTFALIEALYGKLSDKIITSSEVLKIQEDGKKLVVQTTINKYSSEKAIITIPPSLASFLIYEPGLPIGLRQILESKHTWMSNSIKFGLSFKEPFWREKGMSGTLVGQNTPLLELYDHSDKNKKSAAVIGFVNEALRSGSADERQAVILAYLERFFGSEVRGYIAYEEKDWSLDEFTQKGAVIPRHIGANYGDVCFSETYMNEKLIFSGTETSPQFGGYLEGAVISGKRAATLLGK